MIYLILFGVALIIMIILNESSLFYRENTNYKTTDESRCMNQETRSFKILKSSNKVMLFVHGFPSTPAVYRWAGERASEKGWDVSAPLLPGFGTDWRDILDTNFSQWYAYLKDTYLELREKYDTVVVVGTSMGGALTLKLAEEFSSDQNLKPDAVVTIAAPVFINNFFKYGIIKNPLYYCVRTIGWFVKYVNPKNVAEGSSNDIDGRNRWRGYSGQFPRQTYSLKIGLKKIDRHLHGITVPCLILQDRKDRTVPFKNSLHIAQKIGSSILELNILNIGNIKHEHHSLLIYDSTREKVMKRILDFTDRNL